MELVNTVGTMSDLMYVIIAVITTCGAVLWYVLNGKPSDNILREIGWAIIGRIVGKHKDYFDEEYKYYISYYRYCEREVAALERNSVIAAFLLSGRSIERSPTSDDLFVDVYMIREHAQGRDYVGVADLMRMEYVNNVAIVGPTGSGKTTILNKIRLDECRSVLRGVSRASKKSNASRTVPLYVPLDVIKFSSDDVEAIKSGSTIQIVEIFKKHLYGCYGNSDQRNASLDREAFDFMFNEGKIAFMFDGLDEVNYSKFTTLMACFRALLDYVSSGKTKKPFKIFVAMRDVFYDDVFRRSQTSNAFAPLRIDQLMSMDITAYISNVNSFYNGVYEKNLRRIEQCAYQSYDAQEFRWTPLLLGMFVFYYLTEKEPSALVGSKASFLLRAINKIIRRHGVLGNFSSDASQELFADARYRSLKKIAYEFTYGSTEDYADRVEDLYIKTLRAEIEACFSEVIEPRKVKIGEKKINEINKIDENIITLLERDRDIFLEKLFIKEQISQVGVFEKASHDNNYRFTHKLFSEVLAAAYIEEEFDENWHEVCVKLIGDAGGLSYARESILHLCALLADTPINQRANNKSSISEFQGKVHAFIETNYRGDKYYICRSFMESKLYDHRMLRQAKNDLVTEVLDLIKNSKDTDVVARYLDLLEMMAIETGKSELHKTINFMLVEDCRRVRREIIKNLHSYNREILEVLARYAPSEVLSISYASHFDIIRKYPEFLLFAAHDDDFLKSLLALTLKSYDTENVTIISLGLTEAALRDRIVFSNLNSKSLSEYVKEGREDNISIIDNNLLHAEHEFREKYGVLGFPWGAYLKNNSALYDLTSIAFSRLAHAPHKIKLRYPMLSTVAKIRPLRVTEALISLFQEITYLKYVVLSIGLFAVARPAAEKVLVEYIGENRWQAADAWWAFAVNALCIFMLMIFGLYGGIIGATKKAVDIINKYAIYGDNLELYERPEDHGIIISLLDKSKAVKSDSKHRVTKKYLEILLYINKGLQAAHRKLYYIRRYSSRRG